MIDLGFRYRKVTTGRKTLMERSDIVIATKTNSLGSSKGTERVKIPGKKCTSTRLGLIKRCGWSAAGQTQTDQLHQ